jgi:hypothetical protein
MRDVPVLLLGRLVIPVFEPFLELAALADAVGSQATPSCCRPREEFGVPIELLSCLDGLLEEVTKNLPVHGRPGA